MQEGVYQLVSQARWDKTYRLMFELNSMNLDGIEWVNRLMLDYIRGFLVYFSIMYREINIHLKGLHLTLVSWKPYRDEKGWRMMGVFIFA